MDLTKHQLCSTIVFSIEKKATLLVDPFQTHIVQNSNSFNKARGSRHLGVCFTFALLFFMLEIVNLKFFNNIFFQN